MRIECSKQKISSAVNQIEKITGKNLTLPILSCVLFEATKSNLKIKATNLDLGVEVNIPIKVLEEGVVAVPGTILNNFISNLSNDTNIKFEVVGNNLSVSTNHISTLIKTHPHDDFPIIPTVSPEKSFRIDPKDFVRGLKSVWYSAAVSSMKPELSSVFVYQDDDAIVFAATDSFRLAEKRIKIKKGKDFSQILIPFKNIPEIIRLLDEAKEEVEVNLNKNQISFSFGNTYLTSRVIDGVFPDYKQILPKEYTTEVVLLKQDLINSLKIANIFSDKFNQINVRALSSSKTFELKTKNSDVGENVNRIDAVVSGEDIDINFNYKYIIDCFQSIESDSVSLSFNGLNKPVVIRGVTDKSFLYLVMPMNK